MFVEKKSAVVLKLKQRFSKKNLPPNARTFDNVLELISVLKEEEKGRHLESFHITSFISQLEQNIHLLLFIDYISVAFHNPKSIHIKNINSSTRFI